jgi:hypothetical protein
MLSENSQGVRTDYTYVGTVHHAVYNAVNEDAKERRNHDSLDYI